MVKAFPYFTQSHLHLRKFFSCETGRVIQSVRVLMITASLLCWIQSINYGQLPLRQILCEAKKVDVVKKQFWNGRYQWNFLHSPIFVQNIFLLNSKVEIFIPKQLNVHWKLFYSAVNKEAVGSRQMSSPSVPKNNEKKKSNSNNLVLF